MRHAVALILVALTSVWWYFSSDAALDTNSNWIIAGYVAACLLGIPAEIGLYAAILICFLLVGLHQINETKIHLTHMPLTWMDLKIAYSNPYGLLGAMKIGQWVLVLLYFILGFIVLVGLAILGRRTRKLLMHGLPVMGTTAGGIIVVFSVVMLWQFGLALKSQVQARVAEQDYMWGPDGVTQLCHNIGLVPFLAFSYFAEAADPIQAFADVSSEPPPSTTEISDAINSYVHVLNEGRGQIPNIVIIQAESTFNPNKAFNLAAPVEGTLLSPHSDTEALGQLRVNVVGGGSWITEFETITGLDSRFFGYAGYYTHASVSPYIRQSFATYLVNHGYRTAAFYSVPGDFYNARYAYKRYGFQSFYDSVDLGLSGWYATDAGLIDSVVQKLGPSPEAPFFAYVVSAENHAPHPCVHFTSQEQFVTTLVDAKDFSPNCQLNEYLLRLRSTDQAFERIVQYLLEVQHNSGRPYVVLMYGDHQPHTFTDYEVWANESASPSSGVDAFHNFSAYRTKTPVNESVFHLRSSVHGRVSLGDEVLPAALVPSVLSVFTAANESDVYLGINFFLFKRCGPDFLRHSTRGMQHSTRALVQNYNDWSVAAPSCKQAARQAFSTYRRNGIFETGP
jgi:phosphoglycerol transferase MdoB-like AlkP superfamily enzyme